MSTTPVMSPLMEVIENSTEKWPCDPSEYENLKSYYSRVHNDSLEGYDEWFNSRFHILTSEEIKLREERIEKRDKIQKEISELVDERHKLRKRQKDIEVRISTLKALSDTLLKLINFEVEK